MHIYHRPTTSHCIEDDFFFVCVWLNAVFSPVTKKGKKKERKKNLKLKGWMLKICVLDTMLLVCLKLKFGRHQHHRP